MTGKKVSQEKKIREMEGVDDHLCFNANHSRSVDMLMPFFNLSFFC